MLCDEDHLGSLVESLASHEIDATRRSLFLSDEDPCEYGVSAECYHVTLQ